MLVDELRVDHPLGMQLVDDDDLPHEGGKGLVEPQAACPSVESCRQCWLRDALVPPFHCHHVALQHRVSFHDYGEIECTDKPLVGYLMRLHASRGLLRINTRRLVVVEVDAGPSGDHYERLEWGSRDVSDTRTTPVKRRVNFRL